MGVQHAAVLPMIMKEDVTEAYAPAYSMNQDNDTLAQLSNSEPDLIRVSFVHNHNGMIASNFTAYIHVISNHPDVSCSDPSPDIVSTSPDVVSYNCSNPSPDIVSATPVLIWPLIIVVILVLILILHLLMLSTI